MKRRISLLVVICMLLTLLTACGSKEPESVRVGSLKGPTSIGLLSLMDKAEKNDTQNRYEFNMAAAADELLPLMIKGELDIALIPANAAANLYKKSEGAIQVIDINTLGVLYLVTGDDTVKSIQDIKGRTVYSTGKGTTPEATLRCILEGNGISETDYEMEFKSEATEVAAMLAENPNAVGLLPQPFVTAACMQNEALKVVVDINEEWDKLYSSDGKKMVTGVTVVRKAFADEHPDAVKKFMQEHKESVDAIDPQTTAALAVNKGIIAKEPIAVKAIPECNIVYIDGEQMKEALSGYLESLYDFNPELVGGAVPGDDFYYVQGK